MSKRQRKVNVTAIVAVVLGFAFVSTLLVVGSASGSFLLDTTNPPQTEGGWLFGALLPVGTNIDVDGVDFQVNYDGSDFYLYEDGAIQDRGKDLIGNSVEVYILDWWFYGIPTHSGLYLANVRVQRPILNVTGPIFRSAELDAFGDVSSDLITQDGALTLQVNNYTTNIASSSDMRPMSVVIIMATATEGSGSVDIELDWGEGASPRLVRETFNLDASKVGEATPEGKVGKFIHWCPEMHSRLVTDVTATVYYMDSELTSLTIENPLVKLSSGLELLAADFDAAFEQTGQTFETIENEFQDFAGQTSASIQDAYDSLYGDITLLRDDLEGQLIDTQEWTADQLNDLRDSTEGAIEDLADTFTQAINDLDRRFTVITQRLADPQIQVYAPPVWSSGLPNSLSVEAQNADITGIRVTDESGSLWDELTTSLEAVPTTGDRIDVEIEYEARFPEELWGLEGSHASTKTVSFPVHHQTGFYVDLSGNPGATGLGDGVGVLDVILIAGAVAISIIFIIIGRGRGWF